MGIINSKSKYTTKDGLPKFHAEAWGQVSSEPRVDTVVKGDKVYPKVNFYLKHGPEQDESILVSFFGECLQTSIAAAMEKGDWVRVCGYITNGYLDKRTGEVKGRMTLHADAINYGFISALGAGLGFENLSEQDVARDGDLPGMSMDGDF